MFPVPLYRLSRRTASLPRLPGAPVGVGLLRPYPKRIPESSNRLIIFRQDFREHSFLCVCPRYHARAREMWVHLAYGAKLFDRTIILARIVQNYAVIGSNNQGKRLELSCPLAFAESLVEMAQQSQ